LVGKGENIKGKRLIAVLLGFMSGPFAAHGQFAKQGAEMVVDLKPNQEVQQCYLTV
jgi:hypothetical protein